MTTPSEITRLHSTIAAQIASRQAQRVLGNTFFANDFANKALTELHRRSLTEKVDNPEAFLTWKIKNLILDELRRYKAEISRLNLWRDELAATRGQRMGEEVSTRQHWLNSRGLSADVIAKDEEEMAGLQALGMSMIMPDVADRQILQDRFSQSEISITDLAHKHGRRTPSSMANYLRKVIGTESEPGALSPVRDVIGELSIATANAFVVEIINLDDKELVTDPVAGAITYLELAGTRSPAHKERATMGIAHLRWIDKNQPSQRGLPNKILHRLTRAACFYVLETNDARHDELDDLGLHDDVNVVAATQKAIRKYRN
jgi:hypothetical protein